MANSQLKMETKALTEGAIMAALTAVLAMAGIYLPMAAPLIMLVWTLPVVVICLHHGMRAGALTMAVAGIVILILSTPLDALSMLVRSAGPALVLGYGFNQSWPTEKIVAFSTAAAFVGLIISLLMSVFIMGLSFAEMFSIDTDTINEIVLLMGDYGLIEKLGTTSTDLANYISDIFSLMIYVLPAILAISSLTTALTNYLVAYMVLGKLKITLPPLKTLAQLKLPFLMVYGLVLGMGLTVISRYLLPQSFLLPTIGQNITIIFLAIYFFQGLGVIAHFLGKLAPATRRIVKVLMIFAVFATFFNILLPICLLGVVDVFLDLRDLSR